MNMDKRMFFLLGAPRSGTTLLMRMLNVHTDILTRPEPHLLTPLAHLGYYAHVDKAPYDPFQGAQASKAFVAELPRGELDYLDALRSYTDTLYGRMLQPTGRKYFLDKTPAYSLILPFLTKLYPNAVYVVLTRHPFAIFSSYAESFFDGDWEAAHRFNPILERYVPAMASFLRRRPVPKIYHIRYESLVSDPEAELRAICAVAEIPYSDDLIQYGKVEMTAEGFGDPTGVRKHQRPTTESVHKWATQVAHHEKRIQLLREITGRLTDEDLEVWGFDRRSLWEPLETASHEQANRAQQRAKKWDRHHLERRILLTVRRNIHQNSLGKVLKKLRFTLDVLLRE